MGESRRDRNGRDAVVSTLEPEWVEASADPTVDAVSLGDGSTSPLIVLGAVVAALLAVVALVTMTGAVDIEPPAVSVAPDPIRRTPTTSALEPATTTTTTRPPPPELGPAPADWLTDLAIAFIDDREELQLIDLETGASIVGNQWATFAWPPLPAEVRLLGAPNRSFAIDPREPSDSGRISTTVHTVRLSENADSFGFFSEDEEGYQFFVGSQWGPAQNGLATAPLRATVFAVPGRGVVVSEPDGSSQILTRGGLEDLPTRLGRIVSATAQHVLGVHCDDLGRCVGRRVDWNMENEVTVPVAFAARNLVSLSPDGQRILSADTSSWGIYDVETGGFATGDPRVVPSGKVAWSPEGERVMWVQEGVLVAASADRDLVAFAVPAVELDRDRRVADRADLRIVSLF